MLGERQESAGFYAYKKSTDVLYIHSNSLPVSSERSVAISPSYTLPYIVHIYVYVREPAYLSVQCTASPTSASRCSFSARQLYCIAPWANSMLLAMDCWLSVVECVDWKILEAGDLWMCDMRQYSRAPKGEGMVRRAFPLPTQESWWNVKAVAYRRCHFSVFTPRAVDAVDSGIEDAHSEEL